MTETQRKRWEPFAWVILGLLAAVAVYGGLGTYFNGRADARRQEAAIADSQKNAVVQCQNANESREASRGLWNFVVDLTLASNQGATPQEQAFLERVRAYVDTVYQQHDCDHLERKYPLPSPPSIPATS